MRRVGFATCKVLPEPDVDEELLLTACREAGIEAEMAGWDDPSVSWGDFDLVVPRSTWNYHLSPSCFSSWIEHVNSRCSLLNPAPIMLGNIHKGYLLELERRGIPIVPTRVLPGLRGSGQRIRQSLENRGFGSATSFISSGFDQLPLLRDVIDDTGWKWIVIKPAISAASFLTYVYSIRQCPLAQELFELIGSGQDVMVQEFMPGGEMAMVFINGKLTHGVEKYARFADGVESVSTVACDVSSELAQLGSQVMSCVPPGWLYARVDAMRNASGQWLLSELELIEPSLFFLQSADALSRFIASLEVCLQRGALTP